MNVIERLWSIVGRFIKRLTCVAMSLSGKFADDFVIKYFSYMGMNVFLRKTCKRF